VPLVSIIVPVYKVEKYLKRCVDSLTNQTLSDIEIILVDDGSPDNSGEICDSLQEKDCRIKVIHKTNGGLSSARNAGIKIAQGQYIGFVDSDDDVALDMYEKMYRVAKRENVDFVMSDYQRICADGRCYLKTLDIPSGLYEKKQMRRIIFPNLIMGENIEYGPLLSVWHCLYRTDFLRQNNLCFDEKVRWSEDNIFSAIAGYCCERFYYMKGEGLYHYYQNQGTITTSYRSGAWQVYCTMNEHLHNFFDPIKDFDFSRQLKLHMIYYACNCIGQELTLPKLEAKRGIRNILETRQLRDSFTDFKMPRVGIKLKIQLYLMKYRQTDLLYRIKKAKD
jgi:glycosyltransferase involved in cell wall biosynthesis